MKTIRILLCLALLVIVSGCAVKQESDWLTRVDALREAGFEGRAVVVFGTGHVAGQAFNLSGSSGFIEVTIKP